MKKTIEKLNKIIDKAKTKKQIEKAFVVVMSKAKELNEFNNGGKMRKFLIKIKCFFNFHSWSYYPSFNRLICKETTEAVCNHCFARKTIIK